MTAEMKQKPLDNMRKLMEILGDPQDDLKFIHIAGTNGKGSTACMTANILTKAGYKTGLFTSPYLQKFNERIRVDGKSITDDELLEVMSEVKEKEALTGNSYSQFEEVTAAGFLYFKKMHCDIVVLEAGIGGLRDATNIIKTTLVSVITSIGLDHTEKLGNTLEEIAFQKAGIIKKNVSTVAADQEEAVLSVIRKKCLEENSDLTVTEGKKAVFSAVSKDGQVFTLPSHGNFEISLLGKNQAENASCAIEAVKLLRLKGFIVSDEDIREGLKNTLWAGRFEIIGKAPYFVLDCGHNESCMESLKENINKYFPNKKPVVLTGVMSDKDFQKSYDILNEAADSYVAVNCDYERALPSDELAEFLKGFKKPVFSYPTIKEGIEKSISSAREKGTFVLATGSVYVCGDVRTILTGEDRVPIVKK